MKNWLSSFCYAYKGIVYAFKTQRNFKIHCAAAALVSALGIYMRLSMSEWLWIIFCIAFVITMELVNSAIEVIIDLVSPERNKLAGIAKDLGAAAVLIAAISAFIIGCIIFVPKLI